MEPGTPTFFKRLRNTGLVLPPVGTVMLIALPAIAIKIAGDVAVAGDVTTAVSQTAVEGE